MSGNDFYFVIEGDIHGRVENGQPKLHTYKENPGTRFQKISSKYPLDFALCVGDLTNHGYDGTTGNIFESCINKDTNRSQNELAAFRNLYEKDVENTGIPMYLCIGNHDMPAGHKGVGEYVRDKHNTTWPFFQSKWYGGNYKFKHAGVMFLCLGVYPNNLKWLEDNLPAVGRPVVIWYHYNTVIGERWSDFWTKQDKFKFADVIDGHNVLCICNGHSHDTTIGMFSNVYTVRGSGADAAIVHIKDDKLAEIYFDSGTGINVSTTDRRARFDRWRSGSGSDVAAYNADNHND